MRRGRAGAASWPWLHCKPHAGKRHSVSVAASTLALVAAALIYKSMGPVFTKQSQRAKILIKQYVMCEGGFTQESSKEVGSSALRETQRFSTATLGLPLLPLPPLET